ALEPGFDDRIRARSGAAVMHARLERHVHRRAASVIDAKQRLDLGMRLARALMPPLRDGLAVADDHRSDHRIRAHRVSAALRKLERAAHKAFIVHRAIVWPKKAPAGCAGARCGGVDLNYGTRMNR